MNAVSIILTIVAAQVYLGAAITIAVITYRGLRSKPRRPGRWTCAIGAGLTFVFAPAVLAGFVAHEIANR